MAPSRYEFNDNDSAFSFQLNPKERGPKEETILKFGSITARAGLLYESIDKHFAVPIYQTRSKAARPEGRTSRSPAVSWPTAGLRHGFHANHLAISYCNLDLKEEHLKAQQAAWLDQNGDTSSATTTSRSLSTRTQKKNMSKLSGITAEQEVVTFYYIRSETRLQYEFNDSCLAFQVSPIEKTSRTSAASRLSETF
jgi:hypothetical protein